jgi:hypothetical protein
VASRESSGGAGGAAGVGQENANLAWVCAHAAADLPLPVSRTSGIRAEYVGTQTGLQIDDVGAITSQLGFVLIQSKKNLRLETKQDTPLEKALAQVVDLYLGGVPDGSGIDGAIRPVDPDRDLLVITTDMSAPATVRVELAALLDTLVGHPPHLPLSAAAHNQKQETALTVVLDHLQRLWEQRQGTAPAEADLRALFRVLRLEVLGLEPREQQRAAAETRLTQVLADPARQGEAFDALARMAASMAAGQWWMSRQQVLAWLRDEGFELKGDPRVYVDIAALRARTDSALSADLGKAVINAAQGTVTVSRDIEPLLSADTGNVVVVGAPGAGKTSVAARAASAERAAGRDVVYLRAGELTGSDAQIRQALGLRKDLGQVLSGWMGPGPGTLVIDGMDATRLAAPSPALLAMLEALPGRWRVIVTARTFDLQYSPQWRRLFRGVPVDPSRADARLSDVRHLVAGSLTDTEIQQLLRDRPALAPLFDLVRPRLAELVRNPFNLNLAAGLLSGSPAMLDTVRSQLDLLNLYWAERVATGPDVYVRTAVLEKLARAMISLRRDRLSRVHDVLDASELAIMGGLLSDGVLQGDMPGGYAAATSHAVAFSHAILFDFAAASQILGRPGEPLYLAEVLEAEPDWALVLRPSIDLHLAALWQDDATRQEYFALVMRLATGSPLASNAAAETPVRERIALADLDPLIGYCLDPADPASRTAARKFTSQQLAAALHLPELTRPQIMTAVPVLAAAARRLAESAEAVSDVELADTATVIVNRIRAVTGWQPDWPGAADCGAAAAAIALTALADPAGPGHEQLGNRAADLLVDAIRIDPGKYGPLIARYAEPEVMNAWGVSAAGVLTRAFTTVASHVPGPAADLAVAIWAFTEDRDETTYLTPSQLHRYSGNRQQDLEGARYDIGQAFPALLAQNPAAATDMYLRIMEATAPPETEDPAVMLLTASSSGYSVDGHGALATMTDELASYLNDLARQTAATPAAAAASQSGESPADPLTQILASLTARLRHPLAWSALLSAGGRHPAALGTRLADMLLQLPDLLSSDPPSAAAAQLIQAIAARTGDEQHRRIEAAIAALPDSGYARHLRDRLLGALDRTRITDSAALERLAVLDAQGGPPPVMTHDLIAVKDISLPLTGLAPADPVDPSDLALAAEAVEANLKALNDPQDPGREQAEAELLGNFQALLGKMQGSGAQGTQGAQDSERAHVSAAAAGARLAADPGLTPVSATGIMMLDYLLACVGVAAEQGSATGGSRNATVSAARGIVVLLSRDDWMASPAAAQIRVASRTLLDHPQPDVTAVAIGALPRIEPDPAKRLDLILQRLRSEASVFLRDALLRQLLMLSDDIPAEVDTGLTELGTTASWPTLSAAPQELDHPPGGTSSPAGDTDTVILLLIYLALVRSRPGSRHLLTTWLTDPATYTYRAERVCISLRDWVTAGGPEHAATRGSAFAFLLLPVTAAVTLRHSGGETPQGRQQTEAATQVAATVSHMLRITAIHAHNPLPDDFAPNAFPVLEQLATVGIPVIAHDVVEILNRIGPSEPKRAMLTAAVAVENASGYFREPEGARLVLALIDASVAQHRDRILADPEWTRALRESLEGFVAQGVDAAVIRAHDLGEMFR